MLDRCHLTMAGILQRHRWYNRAFCGVSHIILIVGGADMLKSDIAMSQKEANRIRELTALLV